ncbi:MAG: hypothetical protein K8I82_28275, partial [Anaerolineae bacterium]|nr:hypothetical protein [Anaerolineae bacterium]
MRGYLLIFILVSFLLTSIGQAQETPQPITTDNTSQLVPTVLFGRGPIRTAVISPDGSQLLVDNPLGVWLYTVESLELQQSHFYPNLLYIGFTAENTPIVITTSEAESLSNGWLQTLTTVDLTTGETRYSVEITTSEPLCQDCFSINRDGNLMISANLAAEGESTQITLWDLKTGETLSMFEGTPARYITNMVLSPGGTRLVTREFDHNGNEFFMLWNTETGISTRLSGMVWYDSTQNLSPVFSPDERYLAFSNGGRNGVVVYDVQGQYELGLLPVPAEMSGSYGGFEGLSFSTDSQRLGGVFARTGLVWDIDSFRIVTEHPGVVLLNLLPDETRLLLVTPDQQISLWEGDQMLAQNKKHNVGIDTFRWVKFLPDARTAVVDNGFQIQRWDLLSGETIPLSNDSGVFDVSPDGTRFAATVNNQFYLGSTDLLLNESSFASTAVSMTVFLADPTQGVGTASLELNADGSLFVQDDRGVLQLFKADFLSLVESYGMKDWSVFYDNFPALVLLSPNQQQPMAMLITAEGDAAVCQGMPALFDLPQEGCGEVVEDRVRVMPRAGQGILTVYDNKAGDLLGQVDINPVMGEATAYMPILNSALSFDNRLLAVVFGDRVVVWEITTGNVLYNLIPIHREEIIGSGATQMKEAVAFNSD